jgi:DNA-binding beta-propeller fold protein YncE
MGWLRGRLVFSAFVAVAAFLAASPAAAENIVRTVPEVSGEAIAVNANAMRLYVANSAANRVTAYDANTPPPGDIRNVPVGRNPRYIAVDPINLKVYVSNTGDASLTVIHEGSLATVTLPINGAGPIAIDALNNKIYVLREGNNGEVTVVDGQALTWYAINTGSHTPADLVLNPANRRLYVSHNLSGDVRAIDLTSTSDHPPNVSIQIAGHPGALAYNSVTNKVYVLSDDARGPIVAVDGATHAAERIVAPGHAIGPRAVAVNINTNQIYAGFSNEIVIVDGRTHNLTFIPTAAPVVSIFPDSIGSKTYVLDASGTLAVIDGFTNQAVKLPIGAQASAVAYIYKLNSAYVTGPALTVVNSAGSDYQTAGINAQALWWNVNGSESGWGFNITHQGDTLFGTWFTYDAQGRDMWLVMSDGRRVGRNSYEGLLYRTTGPAFSSVNFDPARVARTPVGTAHIDVTNSDNATLIATVDGVSIRKDLSRQVYALPQPSCTQDGAVGSIPNYQGLWWNSPAGSESGWGLNIAHQGDILFVTWFTYGADGRAMWVVGSSVSKTGNATYAGTLYRAVGPPVGASPWDASRVMRMPAGSISFVFSDANNGRMTYTLDGFAQSKAITRQIFAIPPTICR